MIYLSGQIVLALLFNFFNGLQDIGNSKSEISLAHLIRQSSHSRAMKAVMEGERKRNSALWHRWGAFTYFIAGPIWGFAFFQDSWISAILLCLVFWLMRPLVFNPIVAKGLPTEQSFFHLSKSGWDGWWRNLIGEKAYYFGSLTLFLISLVLIYYFNYHG